MAHTNGVLGRVGTVLATIMLASCAMGLAGAARADEGHGGVTDCDLLAAAPYDAARVAKAVCSQVIDIPRALESCELAATRDPQNTRIRFQLGRVQLLARQKIDAIGNLKLAAASGYSPAMAALGAYFQFLGRHDEAAPWLQEAASLGNSAAQSMLGAAYLLGTGVERDLAEAAKWIKLAAQQDDPIAQYNLAGLYNSGQAVQKDLVKAHSLLERAAAAGIAAAQVRLGQRYEDGEMVTPDTGKARDWYARSANSGQPSGRFHYGRALLNGIGGPKDEVRAFEQFHLAALKGHVASQSILARLYYEGIGVERSIADSYLWASRAESNGDVAAYMRKQLAAIQLSSEEREQLDKQIHAMEIPALPTDAETQVYCHSTD